MTVKVFRHELEKAHHEEKCDECGAKVRHYRLIDSPQVLIVACEHEKPITGDFAHVMELGAHGGKPRRVSQGWIITGR